MGTTLNIDGELLAEAQRITGVSEKAVLVREGLRALSRTRKRAPAGATGRHRAPVATRPSQAS